MTTKDIHFSVEVYTSSEELAQADAVLLTAAREATGKAYAPYSKFMVGAVAAMANGKTVTGTNQENASYPVGICAERVLLSCVATQYPGVPVETIAISYDNQGGESSHPISPCGICRQSLAEYEERVHFPIRIIMSGMKGEVYILQKAGQLLPLSFSASDFK
ncbi:MAG: cytidine deaminase [Ferruginibacter sp.]